MFGLTNDEDLFNKIIKWRDDAINDGWSSEPYFESESIERAIKLKKDGFKASILTRNDSDKKQKYKYQAVITIWGPDDLQIKVPEKYDWNFIKLGVNCCNYCNSENVKTQQVSFAGRCCQNCIEIQRQKLEYNGWNN